jgi:hypothetical protein
MGDSGGILGITISVGNIFCRTVFSPLTILSARRTFTAAGSYVPCTAVHYPKTPPKLPMLEKKPKKKEP